ncbi:hypothetical protein [Klebsiella pneumoniae]|uniref:hypothetical protein n=1 Tax=Klebsiella pneumoniae TaxID=573 RepID=UPI000DE76D3F|nr:hypothetical protein [Klebsiella pneumoniae]SSG52020.1 Uncharacterised protein [Klebsiella pneumoniae]
MHNEKNSLPALAQAQDALARKVVDLIRQEMSGDEIYQLMQGDAMWLAMQMICGPNGAACCIRRSAVSSLSR